MHNTNTSTHSDFKMVTFRVMSDLHLEFYDKTSKLTSRIQFTEQDQDSYLILAGDVGVPIKRRYPKYTNNSKLSGMYIELLHFLKGKFKGVILVSGNHEYYLCTTNGITMDDADNRIRAICEKQG